ncbi:MAG: response regulator [Chloroflexota bacterium]
MGSAIDIEVLLGFIEEAHSYLPAIRQVADTLPITDENRESITTARRYCHIVKGASSMLGFAGISHVTNYIEETIEDLVEGDLEGGDDIVSFLNTAVSQLELYLSDEMMGGEMDELPLLTTTLHAYRRMRGLPEEGDETAVAELLTRIEQDKEAAEYDPTLIVDNSSLEDDNDGGDLLAFYMDEDVLPELREAFAFEAEDHLREISTHLSVLDKDPEQLELVGSIRRSVHTLKGAAATVGLQDIATLSHRMEDLLDKATETKMAVTPRLMHLLFSTSDMLEDMVHGVEESAGLTALLDQYTVWLEGEPEETAVVAETAVVEEPDEDEQAIPALEPLDLASLLGAETILDLAAQSRQPARSQPAKKKAASQPTSDEVIRVPLDKLDELVRLASELIITRTTFDQRLGDLNRLTNELQPSIDRLRRIATRLETQYEVAALAGNSLTQARDGETSQVSNFLSEFDELEFDRYTEFHLLSRELSETTSDIRLVGTELNHLIGDFEGVIENQGYISSELQDKLMRTRMLPFATLTTRLQRAVRVVAHKQGKLVDLVIEGEDVELDKQVLDEIADPLLHVLRNAVDHGIEPSELRQTMGKPARGTIHLNVFYEGSQVIIQIADDGAGLQPERLRAKAVSSGFVSEMEANTLTKAELHSLIFAPGFSTAETVDELSGRGVGLDVLKSNVYKLKGTVMADSEPGEGMTFTVRLPMTLAVSRALLIKANHETFALPLTAVALISRIERKEVVELGGEPVVQLGEEIYPLLRLGDALQLKQPPDDSLERLPVLVLKTGDKQVALLVDEIVEGREIVVKPLGSHLRHVHGVTGATLMGDGRPVLILNPTELVEQPRRSAPRRQFNRPAGARAARKRLSVMVVDDSVSVRRVVTNLVKSVGWEPIAAKDGVEAWELLQSSTSLPDTILMDIEMPRMDGYELTAKLRANSTFRQIPIVMLTSRAGEKHRRKAMELGVSAYMVKPYTDSVLINTVRQLAKARE